MKNNFFFYFSEVLNLFFGSIKFILNIIIIKFDCKLVFNK